MQVANYRWADRLLEDTAIHGRVRASSEVHTTPAFFFSRLSWPRFSRSGNGGSRDGFRANNAILWVSVFIFWKIIALSRFFDDARVLPNRHRQIPALLAPFYAGGFAPESLTFILAHRNLPRPSLTVSRIFNLRSVVKVQAKITI